MKTKSTFKMSTTSQAKSKTIHWFNREIFKWFNKNGRYFPWRNKSVSKYQVIIAEVLLQRTKAETVANFFPEFIKRYPSWRTLSTAKASELKKILKPIGLWRRRSATIKKLSKEMARRNGRFPRTREEIEKLPGVDRKSVV